MRNTVRRLLRLLLLAVFVISTVLLLRQMLDKCSGNETYDTALAIAMQKTETQKQPESQIATQSPEQNPVWIPEPVADDPVIAEMEQINLEALQQVNPDVFGWIRIPDTKVDYPLLQGEDNEYYLKHTWEKKKNSMGSVFLEHWNSRELTDYNTIVYAHNMNDGSMFGTLSKYNDKAYWKKHPYVYIATGDGVLRYEIFAFYKAAVDSPTYGLSFNQLETKANFLHHAWEEKKYDTGVIPEPNDRILTLSTCTASSHEKRWVVQARLKMTEVRP